jgi:hypothetical protein
MVTDFDPFLRVIKIGTVGGLADPEEVFLCDQRTRGWAFGELRGGTPLLSEPDDDDGWLYGFIHSYKTYDQGFQRFYYYTIARFSHVSKIFEYYPQPLAYVDDEADEDYDLLWKYSNNKKLKVIFPIGIMHHDEGVVVSFGKDDVSSFTEYFSWQRIKSYFNSI